MGKLTIRYQFFTLFIHHARGLTVVLPDSGHEAKISGPGLDGITELDDADIVLSVKDASGVEIAGRTTPAGGGFLQDVTTLDFGAKASVENARQAVTSPAVPGTAAARFQLTMGAVMDAPMRSSTFANSSWSMPHGNPGFRLTDFVTFELPLLEGHSYALEINGRGLHKSLSLAPDRNHSFVVTNGDTGISESDCPTETYPAPGDPFRIDEFQDLFRAVGVTVGVPETPMPEELLALKTRYDAALAQLKKASKAVEMSLSGSTTLDVDALVTAYPLTICRPCPSGMIVLE